MSQLKVFLNGIALTYFDMAIKNWRIFVPLIPQNHIFRISVIQKEQGLLDKVLLSTEVPVGSKLTLSNNSLPTKGDFDPIFLDENFNLSELHNEPVTLDDEINKYAAFVLLKGFPSLRTLLSSDLRSYRLLRKIEGSSQPPVFVREDSCRDVLFSTAQPANGSKTTLQVNGKKIIGDLIHSSKVGYEVVLDNDCHRIHHPDDKEEDPDFKYFYNIIDKTKLQVPCEFKLEVIKAKCEVAGCGPGFAGGLIFGPKVKAHLATE